MNSKKGLIVLTATGLLVGSLGFVGAQNAQSGGADTQSQSQNQTQNTPRQFLGFGHGRGFGDDFGRGFGGLPFGEHLALGTAVKLEFYTSDPNAAGSTAKPTQTLNFTYGQDSEAAFAQDFAEARANAGYMVVNVGEQTQTLELPSNSNSDTSFGRGEQRGGVYGALPLGGLNEGSSVQATFYSGDPEANGEELQTLNFTYGQDSEAGFADAFASAAQNAAYVTVKTSPQTYTVNLSAVPNRGFTGRGGFDGQLDGRFDGGFRGGFGRGPGHRR